MGFKRVFLSTPSFKQIKKEHTMTDYSIKEGIVIYNYTYCSPLGQQASDTLVKGKEKRESNEGEREREGSTKGKKGSIKCHKFLLSFQSDQGVAKHSIECMLDPPLHFENN